MDALVNFSLVFCFRCIEDPYLNLGVVEVPQKFKANQNNA